MLTVLLFSDPEVKKKLFERVDSAVRPLLVVQVRADPGGRPVDEREPFAAIEDVYGRLVDQVLVADDNTPDGMWRDPVGDLTDRLFPHDRTGSYAASTGFLLLDRGRVLGTLRKQGGPRDQLWFLQELLSAHVPGVPPPDPRRRPGTTEAKAKARVSSNQARRPGPPPPPRSGPEADPEPTPPPGPPPLDPWAVLGIAPDTPLPEAKRAFRNIISQYHPDKVSHLAPEFRELADRRTREILDAWRLIEEGGDG